MPFHGLFSHQPWPTHFFFKPLSSGGGKKQDLWGNGVDGTPKGWQFCSGFFISKSRRVRGGVFLVVDFGDLETPPPSSSAKRKVNFCWGSGCFGNCWYAKTSIFFSFNSDIRIAILNLFAEILQSPNYPKPKLPVSWGADDWTEYLSGKYWAGGGVAHSCPQAGWSNLKAYGLWSFWEIFCPARKKIVHFFTWGSGVIYFMPPCWNEINSKWETQSQASWEVQPWWYSSTSFLGSWALLRCSMPRSNFVCWKSSLKIHPPFFPLISSSLFCFVCFWVSTWHETSEPFWALEELFPTSLSVL